MAYKVPVKEIVLEELEELRYKKGYSRLTLVSYLKSTYGLEQSRSYDYIREMMEAVAERYNRTNPDALNDSISYMEEMKALAHGQGNHKLALEWQKELNKVKQLYVEKVMFEAKNIEGINISITGLTPSKKEDNA
jgi:hypothetical protein